MRTEEASRGSSWPRDWTGVSCTGRDSLLLSQQGSLCIIFATHHSAVSECIHTILEVNGCTFKILTYKFKSDSDFFHFWQSLNFFFKSFCFLKLAKLIKKLTVHTDTTWQHYDGSRQLPDGGKHWLSWSLAWGWVGRDPDWWGLWGHSMLPLAFLH